MKLRVLVLDDDEGLLKGLLGMVEELGHIPMAASSAEKAFEILEREEQIDVVLSDVRLPGLSGIDFLKQTKTKGLSTAVILMTAFSDIDLAVLALNTGAFGFLRKPFALKELEVMLRNFVNTMRLEQQNRAMRKLLEGLEFLNCLDPSAGEIELNRILDIALETTRSESGSVLLMSSDGNSIVSAAHRGLDDELMSSLEENMVKSISGKVLEKRETVIIDDDHLEAGDPLFELMKRPDVVSAISAPIECDNRILGLLNLNRLHSNIKFDDADRDLADIFANTLALAVENNRLRAEQNRNWNDLQKMQRQLIQTEKLSSLGQLAAGIAHEVNNPLTSVMGFAELLLRKMSDPTATNFLNKIVSNAERIKRILLDLKDFYVPSKNRMAHVDINRIIENAIPIARVHPESAGISITKTLQTPLPELHCDENQILQVLINLFINAFQSMQQGGQVFVHSSIEDKFVVVKLRDTGVGIPEENVGKIFDPFFTTKSDWKGTGLGLSVCYTIIDNHGGHIEVESKVDEGTTFTVKLPISARSLKKVKQSELNPSVPFRGRILVVDDEADCRDLLRNVLSELGFEVDEAHSGLVAIDYFRKGEKYGLVFLDYKMPDMNGAQTYKKLREIDEDVKVIVLTGSIGQSARMIVELGAQGFISKPFKVAEIEGQLRSILGSEWGS